MNDRHRAKEKYRYYLKHKCPCCHKRMYSNSWYEEIGCVEEIERCDNCGYLNHWSYGLTEFRIGRKQYFIGQSDPNGLDIYNRFKTEIKRYRRKYHSL